MIAKMTLPLLGGSPSVWNTCMAFFQATLLAGYAYAHLTTRLRLRAQIALHGVLLLLPLAVLPIHIADNAVQSLRPDVSPSLWLLGVLLMSVGLPFFLISTTNPLLQRWFASTNHPSAKDPYFLYVASNLGSLCGVLSFPILIEPYLGLRLQTWYWSAGYACLALLTLSCAGLVWRLSRTQVHPDHAVMQGGESPVTHGAEHLTAGRRLRWLALAAVASSLMLGLTTHITSEFISVPLFWVVPLTIYLLTLILVFARRTILPHAWMVRALPIAAVLFAIMMLLEATEVHFMVFHVLIFFVAAMVCHGELTKDRPSTRHLTEFYLWLSAGGVLGGLFNAFIAPLVFKGVAEYPLALVCACLLSPTTVGTQQGARNWWFELGFPLAIGSATAGVVLGLPAIGIERGPLSIAALLGVLAILWFVSANRPVSFGLGIGSMIFVTSTITSTAAHVLYRERTYFSLLRIEHDPVTNCYQLIHGSTVHGQQSAVRDGRAEPLSYYYRAGPVGQVFESFNGRTARPRVAVVGLGIGSLAAYAQPGQHWTFYEIDPAVERAARNANYFTFLQDCQADQLDVVLGDARLRLQEVPDKEYGLIVLDAFSSDAIPVHLLTREALRLYLDKLVDSGMLVLHVSTRHLDLRRVLKGLAAEGALACRGRFDVITLEEAIETGRFSSAWVVMARREAYLGELLWDRRWRPLVIQPLHWTDDYSNILSVLKWR
jgi:hypothetical protein